MCTLILGVEVLGPRTVLLAANRDEDPSRPSDPPLILRERPRVVGGRDRLAGGTWLALRGRHAAVAMLNRRPSRAPARPPSAASPPLRSRGLLALDAAAAEAGSVALPGAILARARELLGADAGAAGVAYAPFSLVVASPGGSWLVVHDGESPRRALPIGGGWHVLTHQELDDPEEPRAAWLLAQLAGYSPASRSAAEARLAGLLAHHADPSSPAVCVHEGRMPTVSSALLWLAPEEAGYAHAEGRPCTAAYADCTHLLAPAEPD